VKRIRPATLEPFDYDRVNLSGELWIAEGFTQYYGPLLEARSGVTQGNGFVRSLGGIVNAVTNAPGRRFFGPIGMSQQAPFTDAAVSIDPQNRGNIFISYYTYGAGIALAIDLSLRSRPGGRSLDDFMRTMWKNHGKPEIPYTLDDARRALATASGDSAWAWEFWKRYIVGRELPEYSRLLENAGILVRKSQAGAAWIGDYQFRSMVPNQDVAPLTINSAVLIGSPLYDAGLERGDRIMTLDGKEMATETEFRAAIAAHKPGDRVTIGYDGRAGRRDASVTIAENPTLQVLTFEDAGLNPTDQQLAFRAKWLSTRQ
jgi:predicted metalloprotease with PDZ domain